MSHRPFVDEEEILVLSTRQPMPRWLRFLLQALAILAGIGLLAAAFIGWRYYAVQQRVKNDLAVVIAHEEEIRALGGINAAPDLIITNAPDAWRYRYLSSIRAHKGRPIPDLTLEKVDYDGSSARAHLLVNGIRQFRAYQLQRGAWRRAPLVATGWGEKQVLPLPEGVEIIYWDEDASFARALADDLPQLLAVMQAMGTALTAESHRLVIIPKEFGDRVRPATRVTGIVLNSPHVDLIPQEPGNLTSQEELRLALARKLLADARQAAPTTAQLPGAARVQSAIDDVMAWVWAVGGVSDAAVADWAAQLKGEWVSPVTGLPPDLIPKLPPNAGDVSARLMMTYLVRQEGVDALATLNAAMITANTWDEAYGQAVGKTAWQVEQAAQRLAQAPDGPLPDWPDPSQAPVPDQITYLGQPSAREDLLLARTPAGDVVLLQMDQAAAFTLADGSSLDFDCIGQGSQLRLQGAWLDAGLQLRASHLTLEKAVLPPALQMPALSPEAWALAGRLPSSGQGRVIVLFPGGEERSLTQGMPIIADPASPPLFVWRKDADFNCKRPWLIAYRPDQGVVDAWLAPAPIGEDVVALDASGHRLLVALYDEHFQRTAYYETGERHIFTQVDPSRVQALMASLPPVRRYKLTAPAGPDAPDAALAVDRATGETRVLFHAGEGEQVDYPVVWVGGPPDRVHFFVSGQEGGALYGVNPDAPDTLDVVARFPGEERLLPWMAACPDGSLLYGFLRPGEDASQSTGGLGLIRPDGARETLRDGEDGLIFPYFCQRRK